MVRAYSQDLRERVKAEIESGATQEEVADLFCIGRSTVVRYMSRWRKQGHLFPDKVGGKKRHKLEAYEEHVKELVKTDPDQTLGELSKKLSALYGTVSLWAVRRFLHSRGYSYKKNTSGSRTRSSRCSSLSDTLEEVSEDH